jgi:hypothetical protein
MFIRQNGPRVKVLEKVVDGCVNLRPLLFLLVPLRRGLVFFSAPLR